MVVAYGCRGGGRQRLHYARCATLTAGASILAANQVSSNAATLTAAATHGSVSSEWPWSITRPPSHAPAALPTLNAPMFSVDARFGAAAAFSTTRICNGGTVANAAIPHTNTVIAAATCE